MTATAFVLTALETGRRLGHALICTGARYASIKWDGADRLDRRFVPPQLWQQLDRVLSDTLEAGPLPADGAISVALLPEDRRRGTVVEHVCAQPFADGPDVAVRLDALLAGLAGASVPMRSR